MSLMSERWIQQQFSGIQLGDLRLNKRAISIAHACSRYPDASLPNKFDRWADIKGAYRLFDHTDATHGAIQAPHYQVTITAARETDGPVLFIQDGSELLYNSHDYTFGLGPTADAKGNGMMLHTCLAASFSQEAYATQILGLGYQKCWVRKEKQESKKESALWTETLQEIGSPPQPKQWISVGDRGNDIYSFFEEAEKMDWGFVVRAKHDRHIIVDGEKKRLHSWVRALTAKKSFPLYLRARGEEFSGEVELELTWSKATVSTSQGLTSDSCNFTYLRVHASGRRKLEWILVTNLSVETEEEALAVVEMYRKRWLIEEYHKALKTGCRIEWSQMRQAHRLQALLGFLGVIACQLLAFKEYSRLEPMQPASASIPKEMIVMITEYFKIPEKGLTVRDFWRLVARLGGFLARKSDGDPGWQTTWRGFMRFQDMMLGFNLL
jgi:hypothetical protein